ncbi:MAG: vWA domain-containing protein [Bacteroidota bacterium]|nr:vWA domain-containing protein [Bacteroidota bacterium]
MEKQNYPQPIIAGYKRPQWICSNQKQLVFILADCSGSMAGEKIDQSSTAIDDLVIKLAEPENKDAFYIVIIGFNDTANVIQEIIKATELAGKVPSMDARGCTDMASALSCAKSQIDSNKLPQLENATWLKPVIIFFSDGNHNSGNDPVIVADELKEKATIVTIAYGSDADEDLLMKLATSSQHYFRCNNGVEIREFMADICDTLTDSLLAGADTADEIAKMDR